MEPEMNHKRKKILLIIILAAILLAGGIFAYLKYNKPKDVSETKTNTTDNTKTTPEVKEEVKPVLTESPLDGTMVEQNANRHPLAIMIENHTQSRPQSGLIDGSIVYETLAEGGITRFMAIYGPKAPNQIGPVRSARTYYVDWAEEYDAYYTHFGGAADALKKIKTDGVKDLNGMTNSGSAFWRKWYPGVSQSEHTAFTDPRKLYTLAQKWPNTAPIATYTFKDDPAIESRPPTGTLSIDFSGNATFAVKFAYDPASNTFLRSMAGLPHKDRITGLQIAPKNIIVQTASEIYKKGKKDHDVQTIGSGKAKFFIDGKMTTGTWTKTSSKTRTIFKDDAGVQIILNRGQTWIAVVRPGAPVVWTP